MQADDGSDGEEPLYAGRCPAFANPNEGICQNSEGRLGKGSLHRRLPFLPRPYLPGNGIDRRIVWHGGVNLLGKADAWDNLIRVEDVQAAAELLEMSETVLN